MKKIWIILIVIVIVIIIASLILINSPGRTPNAFCTTKKGCVQGLYCDTICVHIGSCLPFGQCEEKFCDLVGGPSAEQGYRYKCNDGNYGCFLKYYHLMKDSSAQSYCDSINGVLTKDERTFIGQCGGQPCEVQRDRYICILSDPTFIKSGQCTYYNCGTDICPT